MKNFIHFTPTEIIFGKVAQKQTASLIKKYGGKRVFIVCGQGSVIKSGLLSEITDLLEMSGLKYEVFSGVKPNPITRHANEGVCKAIDFNTDFVLAIGGGSAIDEAKAIAHGAKNRETDVWKYWSREIELTETLPLGVILTISAAGSETSRSSVLTNTETGEKRGLTTELNIPRFAVMNPELTYTVPAYHRSCGIVDIMMHTMDRFFSNTSGNQMTDEIAAALLRTVIENAPAALNEPENYDAVSEIMWCGSLSHNGITGLGRPMDFSVHQLGHELGGRFDVAHGASLSVMWGAWAKYCYKTDVKRFSYFAQKVWNIISEDDETNAVKGIERTVEFFRGINMPVSMTDLGLGILSDEVIDELSDSCVFQGKRLVGNFKPLDKEDIIKIYKSVNN